MFFPISWLSNIHTNKTEVFMVQMKTCNIRQSNSEDIKALDFKCVSLVLIIIDKSAT